jgi:hypothetical protein
MADAVGRTEIDGRAKYVITAAIALTAETPNMTSAAMAFVRMGVTAASLQNGAQPPLATGFASDDRSESAMPPTI